MIPGLRCVGWAFFDGSERRRLVHSHPLMGVFASCEVNVDGPLVVVENLDYHVSASWTHRTHSVLFVRPPVDVAVVHILVGFFMLHIFHASPSFRVRELESGATSLPDEGHIESTLQSDAMG